MAAAAGKDASVAHHPHENINQDQIHLSHLTNAGGGRCLITLTRTLIGIRSIYRG